MLCEPNDMEVGTYFYSKFSSNVWKKVSDNGFIIVLPIPKSRIYDSWNFDGPREIVSLSDLEVLKAQNL